MYIYMYILYTQVYVRARGCAALASNVHETLIIHVTSVGKHAADCMTWRVIGACWRVGRGMAHFSKKNRPATRCAADGLCHALGDLRTAKPTAAFPSFWLQNLTSSIYQSVMTWVRGVTENIWILARGEASPRGSNVRLLLRFWLSQERTGFELERLFTVSESLNLSLWISGSESLKKWRECQLFYAVLHGQKDTAAQYSKQSKPSM